MINCEKASKLTSKKIDNKLSLWEMISLKMHTLICGPCASFEDEAKTLTKVINHNHEEHKCAKTMNKDSKEKLEKLLVSENN